MKVTANIREYIKAEVAKILDAKVNPYTEQAKLDREMIDEFCKKVTDFKQEMIDNFIEDNNLVDTWHDRPYTYKLSGVYFSHAATPAMIKAKEWEAEHNTYKASKTREIIAKLELGANKQELEEMLAELLKED